MTLYGTFSVHVIAALVCVILLFLTWYFWYALEMKIASTKIMIFSMIAIIIYLITSILMIIGSAEIIDIKEISNYTAAPLWSKFCLH